MKRFQDIDKFMLGLFAGLAIALLVYLIFRLGQESTLQAFISSITD